MPNTAATAAASATEVIDPSPPGPISMTQFYPFVLADPVAKGTELRTIKLSQGRYTPAVDYWRLLRLQIMAHHRFDPGPGLDALDTAIELAHPSRKANYRIAVAHYRRFVGRKQVEWLGRAAPGIWEAEDLQVRVNPELWVSIDGEPHVIKLFLRSEPKWALDQRLANPLVHLLQCCHGGLGTALVLDLMRGRAFRLSRCGVDYDRLLRAQAAAFLSLWNSELVPAA
ncbi:MAG: hypothetical protein OEV40_03345 [Acidimicrobiia bacterium]|nr:hypothetical protein [Acidimicrobiia bacterium]